MNNTLGDTLKTTDVSLRRLRMKNGILWTVQGVLALLFLFTGSSKLLMPTDVLQAQLLVPLPILFVRFIGIMEIAGALGLILPGLTRIKPFLTPLAASGLTLLMIGATTLTIIFMGIGPALLPLVAGLLAVWVAYERRPGRHSA
jgi:hypothetical protein